MTIAPLQLIVAVLYWGLVIAIVGVGVAAAALTWRVPRRWLVIVAAAALVAAVVVVALPHGRPATAVTVAIALAALALSVLGGGPAVLFVLAIASKGSVREGDHGGIVVEHVVPQTGGVHERGEVLRGGTVIGVFERVATTASIMAGIPEAVAVVVAIKSVGRFTELDVAEARERFIIGTLVSLVWACACGALFRLAIGL